MMQEKITVLTVNKVLFRSKLIRLFLALICMPLFLSVDMWGEKTTQDPSHDLQCLRLLKELTSFSRRECHADPRLYLQPSFSWAS